MKQEPIKKSVGRPATGKTPKRYFRMSDDDWQQIESAASASGEKSTSEYVRRVLLKDSAKILKKRET